MTQARPQPANDPLATPAGPPSPEQQPGSSKSRQKKFHRHFKQVAAEELVLNCEYLEALDDGLFAFSRSICSLRFSSVAALNVPDHKRTVCITFIRKVR
jgi:hypothetical protein